MSDVTSTFTLTNRQVFTLLAALRVYQDHYVDSYGVIETDEDVEEIATLQGTLEKLTEDEIDDLRDRMYRNDLPPTLPLIPIQTEPKDTVGYYMALDTLEIDVAQLDRARLRLVELLNAAGISETSGDELWGIVNLCDSISDLGKDEVSTYCSSIPREELAQHMKECEVCGKDDGLRYELGDEERAEVDAVWREEESEEVE